MTPIEIEAAGGIRVDATLVANGLGIEPAQLQRAMRDGLVTSLCERGIDEDRGHYRVTFFSQNRRLRLIIDSSGALLQQLTLDLGGRGIDRRSRRSSSAGRGA